MITCRVEVQEYPKPSCAAARFSGFMAYRVLQSRCIKPNCKLTRRLHLTAARAFRSAVCEDSNIISAPHLPPRRR